MLTELQRTLGLYEAGAPGGFEAFAEAAETFARLGLAHIELEESVVVPLAKEHLKLEDWAMIAEAFGENGDPRFGEEPDHEFRNLFHASSTSPRRRSVWVLRVELRGSRNERRKESTGAPCRGTSGLTLMASGPTPAG